MVIPLMATIISLTFFFGWAMTNQQHVRVSGRYTAWRQARRAGGASGGDLNRSFFAGRAEDPSVSGGSAAGRTQETITDLVRAAGDVSDPAYELAEQTAGAAWPRGVWARVAASFPSDVDLWRRFQGAIRSRRIREGVSWRRGQVSYLQAIRDQYLIDLAAAISEIPDAGLQDDLRRLYLQQW